VVDVGTRERILSEASALLAELGFAAFSMRKLAERLSLTATAIYRHFESKEALVSALCGEGFRLFAEHLWKALSEPSALGRMQRTRLEYLHFALRFPNYYRAMFMGSAEMIGWDIMPEDNQLRADGTFQFLVDRVRECQAHGLLREGDAAALAVQLWSLGHGLVSLRLAGYLPQWDEPGFEAFYVAACQNQFRGLGV
jgi:AcrR family transcriptional regulator